MNICTVLHPVQVHVTPSSPIIEHASVKVYKGFLRKKTFAVIISAEEFTKNSVTWINFFLIWCLA